MARLQDFQTVTPTSSDKLLVVQSQGQGLVPYGSKLDSANPTGTGALSLNRKSGTTTGSNSVAVGTDCTASTTNSFAEGRQTTSTGAYGSHAEGNTTTSSGGYGSHAEGYQSQASGAASHSENSNTIASGENSHAEGLGTKASRQSQHVFGQYNIEDTTGADASAKGSYIEVVGKGTNNSNRSNARTLDWSGNEVLAGGLKINSTETVTALKQSSVTLSKTATDGQYVSDLDFSTYRITNAWLAGEKALIITRPSLQNKVVFNIYRGFQPITDNSITVNFYYL